MKISYQWLKELTALDWSAEEVAERLTLCGTACEDIIPTAKYMDKVFVGEVLDLQPIEGASKIRLATVNIGLETLDLVCGAPNVAVGQKVPVATMGAKMANGMVIKKVKIRGVVSCGMICSEVELGISEDHSGIMVLDPSAEIGRPLVEELDYDDYILEFELTPNRGDSMSALGIARDLVALSGEKLSLPKVDLREVSEKATDRISVKIEDSEGCPRYAARVIKNIKIGESPWWVKKKLLTAGIRPISNIVDVTNLVMLESGNPLHAFDLDLFGSSEVLVRRAKEGELFTTLDDQQRKLSDANVMISNGSKPVAVGGVMGGLESEVVDRTKTILLEAAYFDPSIIRKSRKQIGLVTESSQRFEKGVDPNNVPLALDRAAYLFQELCGGEVLEGIVDQYPVPIKPNCVTLRPSRCVALLGTEITTQRMKEILTGLEFDVSGDDPLIILAPTFRHDISSEIDLIEEVVRIHGFDNVPDSVENKGPLFAPQNPIDQRDRDLRRLLTGAGLDEILDHGLAHSRKASLVAPEAAQLRIINPVSEDLDIVRNSLIPSAIGVISHNVAHRNMNLRLFEIGKAIFPPDKSDQWLEEDRLLLAMSGQTEGNWREAPRLLDFHDLVGAVETLVEHYRLPSLKFEPTQTNLFEAECSFKLFAGETELGQIGSVSSKIARKFDLKERVFLAEMRISSLVKTGETLAEFADLPSFPAAPRDLALVVAQSEKVGEIISAVKSAAGDLAEAVQLFDLYTGKQIESGMKSVGIAITYRSLERSLSSEEVDSVQQKVVKALQKQFGAEIRDK